MDESGDFTDGAGLSGGQADIVLAFTAAGQDDRGAVLSTLRGLVGASAEGLDGIAELEAIGELLDSGGYAADRIAFDPGVVRGLDYYTGPVFEGELTFEIHDEAGRPVRFGSVAGGGRYDGLVERFLGRKVPATGASIGVDRLAAALDALRADAQAHAGPVVVLVLDRARLPDYQRMVAELRGDGVRAELYLGDSGMRAQLKYADKRNAPVAVIAGEDEFAQGTVTIKDLMLGAELSGTIQDRDEWRRGQPAQQSVPRAALCQAVRAVVGPRSA
jgi:histidyl-tRNA synthetase